MGLPELCRQDEEPVDLADQARGWGAHGNVEQHYLDPPSLGLRDRGPKVGVPGEEVDRGHQPTSGELGELVVEQYVDLLLALTAEAAQAKFQSGEGPQRPELAAEALDPDGVVPVAAEEA